MAPTRKTTSRPAAPAAIAPKPPTPVTRAEFDSLSATVKTLVDRVTELEEIVEELIVDEDEEGESLGSQDSDTNDESANGETEAMQ